MDPPAADPTPEGGKRTLYQILGAKPSDSRDELKAKYVQLAKQSHPDAVRQTDATEAKLDFTEIAAAWRILSDTKQRKRYDRSLQAEQFSLEVQQWAEDFGRQAAPAAKAFGEVALPFLRKTTAATLASIQAAANDLSQKQDRDVKATFSTAMEAAIRAGRYVDSMELMDKSERLKDRAMLESDKAAKTEKELEELAQRRLLMALHTPGSGLTAAEAAILWKDFRTTVKDHLTAWDRAMLKHTVGHEISELKAAEDAFVESQQQDSQAQMQLKQTTQGRLKAKQALTDAEKAEAKARQALLEAEAELARARTAMDKAAEEVTYAEAFANKSDYELERRSLTLVKQSEKVRSALREKEKQVLKQRGVEADEETLSDQVSAERLKELKDLKRQERLLSQDSARLENKAARLLSRSTKLKSRAVALERLESKRNKA